MLLRINRDDAITGLRCEIFDDDLYDDNEREAPIDWGRAGAAIGENSHLRSLEISYSGYGRTAFWRGMSTNRSIERLVMEECKVDEEILACLHPFFEQNSKLRSVCFYRCNMKGLDLRALSSALSKGGKNTLRKIDLYGSDVPDDQAAELISSLSSTHQRLTVLGFGGNDLGKKSCAALAKLLAEPAMSLQELDVSFSKHFGDECIKVLSDALVRTTTLQTLHLSGLGKGWKRINKHDLGHIDIYEVANSVTQHGWSAFSAALRHPMCSLQTLSLGENELGGRCLITLVSALIANATLKCLHLRAAKSITEKGWRTLSTCFGKLHSLEELDLEQCGITDEGSIAIATSLKENATLQKLTLSDNDLITPDGWRTCFNLFRDSPFSLEELYLNANRIDYDGAAALAEVFANTNSLRILQLSSTSLTEGGCQLLLSTLVNPGSRVENLLLSGANDNFVPTSLANALVNNTSLKEFHCIGVTNSGWAALTDVLCNTSSIERTYSSNHTLHEVYPSDPTAIDSLLKMNKSYGAIDVARRKVLEHHFSKPDTDIQVFDAMDWKVLPQAIAWMGRDELGLSLLYNLPRHMPSLFAMKTKPSAGPKRKIGVAE